MDAPLIFGMVQNHEYAPLHLNEQSSDGLNAANYTQKNKRQPFHSRIRSSVLIAVLWQNQVGADRIMRLIS
jgi:hypothetical protein